MVSGDIMIKGSIILAMLVTSVIVILAGGSNYMYESSSVNGVGYKADEKIIQTYEDSYKPLYLEVSKTIYTNNTINYYEFACWLGV